MHDWAHYSGNQVTWCSTEIWLSAEEKNTAISCNIEIIICYDEWCYMTLVYSQEFPLHSTK